MAGPPEPKEASILRRPYKVRAIVIVFGIFIAAAVLAGIAMLAD